jgi:hypothetical protein
MGSPKKIQIFSTEADREIASRLSKQGSRMATNDMPNRGSMTIPDIAKFDEMGIDIVGSVFREIVKK